MLQAYSISSNDPVQGILDAALEFWPSGRISKGKVAALYHAQLKNYQLSDVAAAMKRVMLDNPDAPSPSWSAILNNLRGGTPASGCEFDKFVKGLRHGMRKAMPNFEGDHWSDEKVVLGHLIANSPAYEWNADLRKYVPAAPSSWVCGIKHNDPQSEACVVPFNLCYTRRQIRWFVADWLGYFRRESRMAPSWLETLAI